ncbi:unnamed protein product, partial [Iphiclides podalirius]
MTDFFDFLSMNSIHQPWARREVRVGFGGGGLRSHSAGPFPYFTLWRFLRPPCTQTSKEFSRITSQKLINLNAASLTLTNSPQARSSCESTTGCKSQRTHSFSSFARKLSPVSAILVLLLSKNFMRI